MTTITHSPDCLCICRHPAFASSYNAGTGHHCPCQTVVGGLNALNSEVYPYEATHPAGQAVLFDLPLRLALATVECQEDGYHCDLHSSVDCPPSPDCPTCNGTGHVPWLKGVRVEDGYCRGTGKQPRYDTEVKPCHICQGRGWTVSEDTEVWLEAAKPEMRQQCWILRPSDEGWKVLDIYFEMVAEAPTVKEALQLALEKVVPK